MFDVIRTYPRSSPAKSQPGLNLPASAHRLAGSQVAPAGVEEAARGVVTALDETDAEHAPAIVNVVGPLGVGKTRLLATLSSGFVDLGTPDGVRTPVEVHRGGRAPLAIDGVDTDRRADAAARFLDRAGHGRFLIASRLPLASRPGWAHRPLVTVELGPWPPADIRGLAAALGVTDPARADLVVRLGGGIPLVADSLCRAIRRGGEPGPEGALADAAATEVLLRLGVESRGIPPETLPIVAAVDGADEDLLTALARLPPGVFTRLRRLSVIRPDRHGLTVTEPYRTLFDLAYRWRHPVLRDDMAARAAEHRHRQLARTADPPLRARLADQVLYLSGSRRARRDLYADERGEFSVRRAGDGDDEAIGRLIRLWGDAEGLAERQVVRMRDLWLSGADHGFHLAVDTDDHAVGMVNLTPLDPDRAPALEPLLQQHADTVLGLGRSGSVVGMMAVEPRFAGLSPHSSATSSWRGSTAAGSSCPRRGSPTRRWRRASACAAWAPRGTISTGAAGRAPCSPARSRRGICPGGCGGCRTPTPRNPAGRPNSSAPRCGTFARRPGPPSQARDRRPRSPTSCGRPWRHSRRRRPPWTPKPGRSSACTTSPAPEATTSSRIAFTCPGPPTSAVSNTASARSRRR